MKTATGNVQILMAELVRRRNPSRAESVARFFKCGPGEYGHGDRFLGLAVPELRAVARDYRGLPARDVQLLLDSEWHEARFIGLVIMVGLYRAAKTDTSRAALYRMYLANLKRGRINNWDLVDVSCEHVVGAYLKDRDRGPLYAMARSRDLWTRRVAIISTFHFIKAGEWKDTLQIAEMLMSDTHDLIHKATGWMLREVGKRASQTALETFLDRHAMAMPRTTLRYAIERMRETQRRRYLEARLRSSRRVDHVRVEK